MTTIQPTDIAAVRRWIRQRQSAHRDKGSTAGNVYFVLLFVAVVGGMLHKQLAVVFWPTHPNASVLAGGALVLTGLGGLFLIMRRLGPLGLSRPAAAWLLTAPVSRRRLLFPSLRIAAVAAGFAGAFFGLAIVGHVAVRPTAGSLAFALLAGGALAEVAVLLAALATQATRPGVAVWADRFAGLLLAAGLAGFVVDSAIDAPRATGSWPTGPVALASTVLAALDVALLVVAVTRLGHTPNERILDASKTAGTLADSAYGVEPSFVAEMLERRYWGSRRLRSARLWGRVPVLVAQDLLLARRRPRRLLWTVVTIPAPALLTHVPGWVLGAVILLGGMIAGGASTANVAHRRGQPGTAADARDQLARRHHPADVGAGRAGHRLVGRRAGHPGDPRRPAGPARGGRSAWSSARSAPRRRCGGPGSASSATTCCRWTPRPASPSRPGRCSARWPGRTCCCWGCRRCCRSPRATR